MNIKKTFHVLFAAILAFAPFAPPAAARHCTLCEAATAGDIPKLRELLDEGAEIDASHWGEGALFYAMAHHKYDAALFLLDRGANPNKRQAGTKNNSPLYLAAGVPVNNRSNILKKMLDKGGDVNDKNHRKPILIPAMQSYNMNSLKLLLKAGAEINGKVVKEAANLRGKAWTQGNKLIIAEMLKYRGGGEFLKYYISKQDVNGLKEALKNRGPNYEYPGENGKTALMHAVDKPNEKLLEALLEKNADVDVQDNAGKTALIHAANKPNEKLLEALLEKNADVDVQDNAGKTALMHAADKPNEKLSEALLEKKPDVNAQDNAGKTALMYATEAGRTKTAKLLLEADANTELADRRGKTVWDIINNRFLMRAIFRQVLLAKHGVDVGEDERVN